MRRKSSESKRNETHLGNNEIESLPVLSLHEVPGKAVQDEDLDINFRSTILVFTSGMQTDC